MYSKIVENFHLTLNKLNPTNFRLFSTENHAQMLTLTILGVGTLLPKNLRSFDIILNNSFIFQLKIWHLILLLNSFISFDKILELLLLLLLFLAT